MEKSRAGKPSVPTHYRACHMPEKTSHFTPRDIQLLEVKLYTVLAIKKISQQGKQHAQTMKRNNGKSKAMYGISRIDDDVYRTHAWRVSLCRRGERHVKNFADKKSGGKGKALVKAKEYRDALLLKHPPLSRKEFCTILRSNNKSGITGVYKYAKSFKLQNGTVKESWYWEAHWPTEQGAAAHMSFSVNEYGEDKARKMAIQARKAALKRLDGYFWASGRGATG